MSTENTPSLRDMPFSELIKHDAELAEIRCEYASRSKKKRQMAASYAYDSSVAYDLFSRAVAAVGQTGLGEPPWPGGVEALAIDPLYAPALLTVGSIVYQYGRPDEAMEMFLTITTLPENTKDLAKIIDETSDFLIDQRDFNRLHDLLAAAVKAFPHVALFRNILGYSLGKLKRFPEALEEQRQAVALEPNNHVFLNDLGWSLVESGLFDEAKTVLEKAASLSPPDFEMARNNLKMLAKLQRKQKR